MIFFPAFAILVLSLIVFSLMNYKDHTSDAIDKTQIVSLVTMVCSFVVIVIDTAVKVIASLG